LCIVDKNVISVEYLFVVILAPYALKLDLIKVVLDTLYKQGVKK